MDDLATLQHQMQQYILQSDPEIEKNIISTPGAATNLRLSVYGQGYYCRLIDALATSYPILQAYVGSEVFNTWAKAYIDAYPSNFPSIRWFGDNFSKFLATHAPVQAYPYLVELASMEWITTCVFDGPDSETIGIEQVAAIAPEQWANMRIKLHPATHLTHFSWNVAPIWQHLTEGKSPPTPEKSAPAVSWIFWRHDKHNRFCSLSLEEKTAIECILNGGTFTDVCVALDKFGKENTAASRAASFLKGWLAASLISEIQL